MFWLILAVHQRFHINCLMQNAKKNIALQKIPSLSKQIRLGKGGEHFSICIFKGLANKVRLLLILQLTC